jgi:hypothetical protein
MDDEERVLHAYIPMSFGPELRACLWYRLPMTRYLVSPPAPHPSSFGSTMGLSRGRALCVGLGVWFTESNPVRRG